MGGNNSTLSVSKTLTQSITNSIIQSIQVNSSFVNIDQELNLNCDIATGVSPANPNGNLFYPACFNVFKSTNNLQDLENNIIKVCKSKEGNWPFLTCRGKDIKLNNFIDIKSLVKNEGVIKSTINNNIEQNIKQAIKSQLGPLSMSTTTEGYVSSAVKIFNKSTLIENLFSALVNKTSQKINLTGGDNSVLTVTNSSDIISDQLNSNTDISNIINNIAADISQTISAAYGTGSFGSIITIVIGVIIIIAILLILVRKISQKIRKNKNK